MLVARSALEAHLYMDLHPCECGSGDFARQHSMQQREGALVSVYEGACAGCGRQRQFVFELLGEAPPPPAFGGAEPSRIIDPGQFKLVAGQITSRVNPELLRTPAKDRRQFRPQVAHALAAVEEVLKFFAEGQDQLPAEVFHSEVGRALYDRDPGKFTRDLVESDIELKRQILADIDQVSPPRS